MCVLTGLRDQRYDWIMRRWISKPQSGKAQYLALFRLSLKTLLCSPHQYQSFSGSSCSSSSYRPPASSLQHRLTAIFHQLPTSSPGVDHHPPGLCTHPPPASLRRSYLLPALGACFRRRVPRLFAPPLLPWPVPRSLSVPGGFSSVGPSVSVLFLHISLPVWILVSHDIMVFGFIHNFYESKCRVFPLCV